MKKTNILLLILLTFSILFGLVSANSKKEGFIDFDKSKNILEKEIYTGLTGALNRVDFYCGCDYSKSKNIDKKSCGYKNIKKGYLSRGNKIEWEHIVPAENFGRAFKEWREGDKKCVNSKGKAYKGRECAQKNKDFNKMEGNIYNLYPVVGELNAMRSNLDYYIFNTGSVIDKNKIYSFTGCSYIVDMENRIVQPKNEIKGDIARTYMYFAKKYPNYFNISDKNMKIYKIWDSTDKVSAEECKRYKKIKDISGEENEVLKDICK